MVALVALILMVVGTMRFGLVLSACGAFVISLMTALSFAFRIGAFGQLDELPGSRHGVDFRRRPQFRLPEHHGAAHPTRRRSAARLQAEHRYAEIFEGSPQPIWVHQRSTLRFLMVNEAALRQYGWSLEEMLSMSVTALIPPGEPLPDGG